MGYFQADERYQGTGTGGNVDAPWNGQIAEAGAVGRVRLTWRAPYTAVDSYGIYGQVAGGGAAAWQEWARIPAPAGEALLTLAPGAWRLCLTARRGPTDSAPTPELCWRVELPLPPLPVARTEPVGATAPAPPMVPMVPVAPLVPVVPSAPAPLPLTTPPPVPALANPQSAIRNPQSPEPEFDWAALDQALHANQAQLGRHGLFVRRS